MEVRGTHFVFSSLNTWGWITVILGVIELTGGFSLLSGNTYGRVFALCVIVLHGLVVYGEPAEHT